WPHSGYERIQVLVYELRPASGCERIVDWPTDPVPQLRNRTRCSSASRARSRSASRASNPATTDARDAAASEAEARHAASPWGGPSAADWSWSGRTAARFSIEKEVGQSGAVDRHWSRRGVPAHC